MLIKFKSQHVRKIIWGLICLIVPAFVLWGGLSYLASRDKDLAGKIENHRIKQQEFAQYIRLAEVATLFQSPQGRPILNAEQIKSKAWQFYLLLWKAKKENIQVNDEKVIEELRTIFTRDGVFDRDWYFALMKRRRIHPREFEEYLRKSLIIGNLFDTYVAEDIPEEEVLDAYKKEHEKAKVAYIKIPYEEFSVPQDVSDEKIEEFYTAHKAQFKEEAKIKLKYILIPEEEFSSRKEILPQALKKTRHIDSLAETLSQDIKETDFLTLNSPIEGLGWEPELIRAAFEAPLRSLSRVYQIKTGYVIFEKIAKKNAHIPALAEVKKAVTEAFAKSFQKEQAQTYADTLLKEIETKKIQDIRVFGKREKSEYGESEYFKFYDYVQGVGLYVNVNEAIFAAEEGEIIPESFSLPKATYLIQVQEKTQYDPDAFSEKKEEYRRKISDQKFMVNQIKFLNQLQQEFNLKIYSNLQQ